MEKALKKHLPLKIILSLLPGLIFWQNYNMMTVNQSSGLAFVLIWALMIWSVSQFSEKNHILERLFRLSEIALFLLPVSAIIFSFVLGAEAIQSTGNEFEQAGAAIGTAIGGSFVVIITFIIGVIGGIIMHLVASRYEKKAERTDSKESKTVSNRHGTILAFGGFILLAIILGSISKGEVTTNPPISQKNEVSEIQNEPHSEAKKVELEVLNKGFISQNFDNQITLDLQMTNKTNKAMRGVEGQLTFYDIFDNPIKSVKVLYDQGIPANESKAWQAGSYYNQFISDDVKLKDTDLSNLTYDWQISTIVYEDGTKETY